MSLPELAINGYLLAPALWDDSEPIGGPITRALGDMARRHGVHLGATLIEADGEHFFNTFVLLTPDGAVAGAVRKCAPAWIEARWYRGDDGPHVIETALGRVGVGICYENYLASRTRDLAGAGVDLLLQPTAAATPPPVWPVGRSGAAAFDAMLGGLAQRHAGLLGVPVVMANMCGPHDTPMPGRASPTATRFPGLSSIVDRDGVVRAALAGEEGVIVDAVAIGRSMRTAASIGRGRWIAPMPWYAGAWPPIQHWCARLYAHDRARAAAARRRSARSG